jgi:hypothetical protein
MKKTVIILMVLVIGIFVFWRINNNSGDIVLQSIKDKHGDYSRYSVCLYNGEKAYTANDAAMDGGTSVYDKNGNRLGASGSPMVPGGGTPSGNVDFSLLTDCKSAR